MLKTYKIQEFAELAGITVKALHHYDRVGLLKPSRTRAGYRVYIERDLERLEQILALKFLGLPLKDIAAVLDRAGLELPEALRLQRRALEERQAFLGRAIKAIREAEAAIDPGKPLATAMLRKIIEVINLQDAIEAMKKYYTDVEWQKRKRYYEEGPGPEWRALYRDARAALGEDPGGDKAQALSDRWLELTQKAAAGEPDYQQDSMKAWLDRKNWPAEMKQRITEFRLEEVTEFIKQAALSSRKRYFSAEAWVKVVEARKQAGQLYPKTWQEHVDLFRDAAAASGEDSTGERAGDFAARWRALVDADSGGDAEVRAGLTRWWADRRNWSPTVRWLAEGLHMLRGVEFDRAADFIDRALGCR